MTTMLARMAEEIMYAAECPEAVAVKAARAALQAIRGMDGHGIDLNYWSERVVDAILDEKPE